MEFQTILFEARDGVATITLNDPERLNPITRPMLRELRVALGQTEEDESLRVLVLTGAGRGFCSGQDLTEAVVQTSNPAETVAESLDAFYHPLIDALRALRVPTIAAINGIAAGAGANIALHCDLVVAAESASFVEAFTRIGLVPDCGGTWLLPRLVGEARARALMMLAEPLSAEEAVAWGLIYEAVPDESFTEEVQALAARLAQGPTRAYTMVREALDSGASHSLSAQLDVERALQAEAAGSADFREGVAAFREKRAPKFGGS